jgi:hypothetical protein
MNRFIIGIVCFLTGAVIGTLLSADWAVLASKFKPLWPWPGVVVGGLAGCAIYLLWLARERLPFIARISSIKVKMAGVGEVEVGITVEERRLLWRFFIEFASRVATRQLTEDEGSIREALASLYGLFAIARGDLASHAPITRSLDDKISAQTYVLRILNDELRPFLARWHPRLTAWEGTGMAEAAWPLARHCRTDLAITRGRILAQAWELGEALGLKQLDKILPPRPASGDIQELTPPDQIRIAEDALQRTIDADRLKVGWRIFVETASRISTQPLHQEAGLLREALQSLYTLFGLIRDELKSMSPTPPTLGQSETIESVAFRLLNEHLRPFLALWHPRLIEWEKRDQPEDQWGDAAACREALETTRSFVAREVHLLGQIIGLQRVEQILGSDSRLVSPGDRPRI